jgi:hypothetical protein
VPEVMWSGSYQTTADGPAGSGAPHLGSSAAGSGSSSSSGYSSRGPSAAAKKSTGSNQGSSASNASAVPQPRTGQIDMSLPLDDCPLLAAHCQVYGPVVAAVAGWPSSPSQQLPAGLRTAVKQCVVAQLAAAGSSSGQQQAYASGKRRTLVPNRLPPGFNSLLEAGTMLQTCVSTYQRVSAFLQQVGALPTMVCAVVQEVAQEKAVENTSAAFTTLLEAGMTAGMLLVGVARAQALAATDNRMCCVARSGPPLRDVLNPRHSSKAMLCWHTSLCAAADCGCLCVTCDCCCCCCCRLGGGRLCNSAH